MKRKSDYTTALDQLFCDDDKKRIGAIKLLKQIGAAIGPIRIRNQLIPFLNEFLDDEPSIMLALLEQLESFTPILGGSQHEQILLPLLINFCFLDQKEVALKALKIIESILSKNTDGFLDTVKKLSKSEMNVSKECATILMASGIKKVPHLQPTFLQIFKSIALSDNPCYRIIAAKHLKQINQNVSNKDQICKIIDFFFNDYQDLPKLLVLDTLLQIYTVNPKVSLNKLKTLVCMGTWRINLRLCQFANQFSKVLSKVHFKTLLQSSYLKMMNSEDNQIRASSCLAIHAVAKCLSPEQNFSKLYPIILKLSQDKVDFVKCQFARNFIKIFPYFSSDITRQCLIPIVIKCLKQSSLEVSTGMLSDFKQLSKHLKEDKFQQNILKPIVNQLSGDNWRLSIQTLDILGIIVVQKNIYTNLIIETIIKQLKSRIQAVRVKASNLIVNVIKNSPKDWCQSELLPLLLACKDQPNYLVRQRVINIMSQSADYVSIFWLSNYKNTIGQMLSDKVPNIRILALKSIGSNHKLLQKAYQPAVNKMKDDYDLQIKQAAREIKI